MCSHAKQHAASGHQQCCPVCNTLWAQEPQDYQPYWKMLFMDEGTPAVWNKWTTISLCKHLPNIINQVKSGAQHPQGLGTIMYSSMKVQRSVTVQEAFPPCASKWKVCLCFIKNVNSCGLDSYVLCLADLTLCILRCIPQKLNTSSLLGLAGRQNVNVRQCATFCLGRSCFVETDDLFLRESMWFHLVCQDIHKA